MRFSIVAVAAVLATAVSAADYGYAPVPTETVTAHETYIIDCEKEPTKCPGNHYGPKTKTSTTTVNLHPTGVYGNGSHPIQTPTYPIGKPPGGGDDKYDYTTLTTTICVPTTKTYVTSHLKPTTPAVKPTGAPVTPPNGTGPKQPQYTGAASSLKMGSFAIFAGAAAIILA